MQGRWLVLVCVTCCVAQDLADLASRSVTALEVSDALGEERGQFDEFVERHQKTYEPEEREKRFRTFRESLHFVKEHNSDPHRKFTVGINEFADWDQEEFGRQFLVTEGLEEAEGLEDNHSHSSEPQALSTRSSELAETSSGRVGEDASAAMEMGTLHQNSGLELPRHVDWSDVSGKVYKQGVCAACYTFATNSAIKAQYQRKTGKTMPELSDQQILSCSRAYGNHGCVGGNMEKSYRYILEKKDRGRLAVASDYPYTGKAGHCRADKFETTQTHLKGYRKIERGSESDLQDALTQHPVAVGIDAHHPAFKLYVSGVFDVDYCTTRLTHAVLLTGFGVDEDGNHFYNLKNSWGDGWGQKGFGKIKRGKNMCAVANLASYPVIDAPSDRT